jgi:trk system potassium uptake protein TrkA
VIEAEALETSALVGKTLKESNLPKGVIIGAIVRDEKVISPRGDTIIDKNDSVVLLSTYEVIKQVEKLFSVRVDFF